MGIHKGSVALY